MKRFFSLVVLFFICSALAFAQSAKNTISEFWSVQVKPGSEAQLEEGAKKHFAWHKSKNDPFAHFVWQVLTGPNTGEYLIGVTGRQWKDFDGREQMDKEDDANAVATIGPYIVGEVETFWTYRADLSLTPEPASPVKFMAVYHYMVKPEKVPEFLSTVKRINAGLKQTNYPALPSRWYSLASGGTAPDFVMIADRNSYADMQGPEKQMSDALDEAYGKGEGDALIVQFRSCFTNVRTYLAQYRPDLSYVPSK